jgi:hypothetical protein
MPITPFHFGPGAAIHAAAPRYVSFLAFCAANVLMDIEPMYYILTRQYPLHRFFHTYVGAAIVAIGATAGTFSHVLLDSVMHSDIRPFAPFSDSNPLRGVISVQALQGLAWCPAGWPSSFSESNPFGVSLVTINREILRRFAAGARTHPAVLFAPTR